MKDVRLTKEPINLDKWWQDPKIETPQLPDWVVRALVADGLDTAQKVRDAGEPHILRLPNIGATAMSHIKAWLRSLDEENDE